MKIDQVKGMIQLLQSEIDKLLSTSDVLDKIEREKMFRNIESLMRQMELEVIDLVETHIAIEYEKAVADMRETLELQKISTFESNLNSQVHKEALATITSDTMSDLEAAFRTAVFYMGKTISDTISEINEDISKGVLYGENRKKIIARVHKAFEKEGMTSFVTIDNRRLPLDFYAETVTRTKLSQARVQGSINTYLSTGNDLVEVFGNTDTCAECAAYQGTVFSITGKDSRFKKLDVREVIPVHPNCRCGVKPYILDFKSSNEVQKAVSKSKRFRVGLDPRTQEERDRYEKAQARKRKENVEKKEYRVIKSVLKDEAPKSLGAYRRMKRMNTTGYKKIKEELRGLK
ncbi:phage minor capsid protein [Staphylococcus xylosus]